MYDDLLKKNESNKCRQRIKIRTLMHYWWDCKMLQTTMENSMAVPQTFKSRTSKFHFWVYTKKKT